MNTRRNFLKKSLFGTGMIMLGPSFGMQDSLSCYDYPDAQISEFARSLQPIGRKLELKGYYVWCNTPIYDKKGDVHVFFSRWKEEHGMSGWIHKCEISHAVADSPEGTFEIQDTALAPRKGYFDATTCHNPHIQEYEGTYYLFYMGNSNGKTDTKRIGLATSDSLYGPWQRKNTPLLDVGPEGEWDDHCTTNPTILQAPDGTFRMYYKSWNSDEYNSAPKGTRIKGNRKYGLSIAKHIDGPYKKYDDNPIIDFSGGQKNEQLEDAFVWYEDGKYKLIARDMGFFNNDVGLYFEARDGINWPKPQIAYYGMQEYFDQGPAPEHLSRYGRMERPQLLMKAGKPEYLFATSQGGKYRTASAVVFKITG